MYTLEPPSHNNSKRKSKIPYQKNEKQSMPRGNNVNSIFRHFFVMAESLLVVFLHSLPFIFVLDIHPLPPFPTLIACVYVKEMTTMGQTEQLKKRKRNPSQMASTYVLVYMSIKRNEEEERKRRRKKQKTSKWSAVDKLNRLLCTQTQLKTHIRILMKHTSMNFFLVQSREICEEKQW